MTTGCLASASLRTGWRYVYLCICICPFCIWNANFVFWQVTCWILYSFLFRFALGHGTPSWRSGTKQEDFEFPKKKFNLWPNFPPQLEQTLSSMISKKGILRTVGFRFETTTVSNLEKQHFLKPAKLQDSESVCQAQSVLDETTSTLIAEDFGVRSGRSFCKIWFEQGLRIASSSQLLKQTVVEVAPSNLTSLRLGNQSQK